MSSRSHTATLQGSLLAALLAFGAPALAADVTVTLDAASGFVVEDNTATIERLRVDEATGNISRNGALFVHTTGTNNIFVGEGAGNPSTTGDGHNSAFGRDALRYNTIGSSNSAFGYSALRANTTGHTNNAFGHDALRSNTTGFQNSAFGEDALQANTTGYRNSAFGENALEANTTGSRNSAFGGKALFVNTTGYDNSAFGGDALRSNTTGLHNSAFGKDALRANTTAGTTSAFGHAALYSNTMGVSNSAFGREALRANTGGNNNSAFGWEALTLNTTGHYNVAIGRAAGASQNTGSNNIYIANRGSGGESGKIKIGSSAHTETFIEGIRGNTASGGVAVLINSSNELHTLVFSARFKQDVREMGEASEVLMALRPVTFRYREEVVGEDAPRDYGLIAEEVAEVAPELVALDAEGQPYSVRYHVLPSLLLNEMQKQRRTMESQAAEIESLRAQQLELLATLTTRIEHLEAGPQLARVEAIQ
jgi:hypothetical protein